MFVRAAYPIPDFIPEQVQVWRGVSGRGANDPEQVIERARRGLSWTLERGVACWFATRSDQPAPAVIRAVVPRSAILFYDDGRGEAEVVLADDPNEIEVDGIRDEWTATGVVWREAAHLSA